MVETPFSPTISIGIFIITTIIFYIVKVKLMFSGLLIKKTESDGKDDSHKPNKGNKSNKDLMLYGIYLVIILCIEFTLNYAITKSLCGTPQWSVILKVTLIPWIVIFGSLKLLLLAFPGWLLPFSNTIGYGIISLLDSDKYINQIFEKTSSTLKTEYISILLERLYDDKSILINQLMSNNYNEKIEDLMRGFMGETFKERKKKLTTEINELHKLIIIKEQISEFIWNILVGILTTSVSYNYIVKTRCQNSVQRMQQRHEDYAEMIEDEDKIDKVEPAVRIIDGK